MKAAFSLTLALGLAGCKSDQPAPPATIVDMQNGVDPAAANLATVDPNAAPLMQSGSPAPAPAQPGRVLGQRSEYAAPAPYSEQYGANDDAYDLYDSQVNAGQDALDIAYADQAPPPLPVYDQPELTQANDQWTPGYWNYANTGYYFVPGAWVAPPYAGALWTPGYWGYEGRRYRLHRGFWGRHIGYYGGINYGFGYGGRGYEGGYWNNNTFYYNQRVNRVNLAVVRNVYQRNIVVGNNYRYSYNGPGGYQARPVAAELAVYREQRIPPMQAQVQLRRQAAGNRQQFFAENHGRPAVFVAPQRFNADRQQQQRSIQPVQRGGFGQQPGANPQLQQQQRVQVQQQRNLQQQQRTTQQEQRNIQQQQRNVQLQQQSAQRQQQNVQRQQQNVQRQQQNVQRQQQNVQQRNVQQQRVQQRSTQTAQQQQRIEGQQQRNAVAQQQNAQRQQQVQAQQQRTQQNVQAQQQRTAQQQQRAQGQQQRQQMQQRTQQQQQQQQQQQRQQVQPQREAARPQPQAPRPQAAPQAQAPRGGGQQHHGGDHPHR